MGGGLLTAQEGYLQELQQLVRHNFFKSSEQCKNVLPKLAIRKSLEEIWPYCCWYPAQGSLDLATWRRIGIVLHNEPCVDVNILTSWKALMIALKVHTQLLLKLLTESPSYSKVIILPPALEEMLALLCVLCVSPSVCQNVAVSASMQGKVQGTFAKVYKGDLDLGEFQDLGVSECLKVYKKRLR